MVKGEMKFIIGSTFDWLCLVLCRLFLVAVPLAAAALEPKPSLGCLITETFHSQQLCTMADAIRT